MIFSDFFNVNEKLVFRLSLDLNTEQFTCHVKKIKNKFMAVLISRRDKPKISPSIGDELFIYHKNDNCNHVIQTKIAQNKQFPLLTLFMTELYDPIVGIEGAELPASSSLIENISNDHIGDKIIGVNEHITHLDFATEESELNEIIKEQSDTDSAITGEPKTSLAWEEAEEEPLVLDTGLNDKWKAQSKLSPDATSLKDHFGFNYFLISDETRKRINKVITDYGSADGDSSECINDPKNPEFGEQTDLFLVEKVRGIDARLTKLENIASAIFSYHAAQENLTTDQIVSSSFARPDNAICLSIDSLGITAAIQEPIPNRSTALLSVDRFWDPPLHFTAVAETEESKECENNLFICRFCFVAINSDDQMSIDNYLARWSEFLEKITKSRQ